MLLSRFFILLTSLSISSQGAIGKCTSLFNFFESTMKKCVDLRSAIRQEITNEVQSELAHLISEDSQNAEVRKRRIGGNHLGLGGPSHR